MVRKLEEGKRPKAKVADGPSRSLVTVSIVSAVALVLWIAYADKREKVDECEAVGGIWLGGALDGAFCASRVYEATDL